MAAYWWTRFRRGSPPNTLRRLSNPDDGNDGNQMISVRPAAPAKSAPKVYDKWYRNEALYGNPLGEVFRTCWSATWRLHRPVRLHRVDAGCAACDHIVELDLAGLITTGHDDVPADPVAAPLLRVRLDGTLDHRLGQELRRWRSAGHVAIVLCKSGTAARPPRHLCRHVGQRRPPGDAPGAQPGLLVIRDAGEPAAQQQISLIVSCARCE